MRRTAYPEALRGEVPRYADTAEMRRHPVRLLMWLAAPMAVAGSLSFATLKAAGCEPLGDIQFVCGQNGPEDLAVVPGSQWVVAGGDTGDDGSLRLIRVSDRTTTIL